MRGSNRILIDEADLNVVRRETHIPPADSVSLHRRPWVTNSTCTRSIGLSCRSIRRRSKSWSGGGEGYPKQTARFSTTGVLSPPASCVATTCRSAS